MENKMQGMQSKHPPFIQLFYYFNYCSWVKLRAMIALEEKLTGEDLFPANTYQSCGFFS
jgi:hypothetical protein